MVLVFVDSEEPLLVQAGQLYSFSTRRLTSESMKLNNICSWGQRSHY